MNSEYGSIVSDNNQSSNSSKCYGSNPASRVIKNLKIRYKSKKKTKLIFMNKSEGNLFNPFKRDKKNSIARNFMKSRSSTQSEDGNKNRSESSMSSTSSVIHMKNMSSIEGIHTFNLKPQQNLSKNPSEYSFDMQSNNSVDSRRSNSTSRAMYVEEKVKIDETKNYNSSLLNEANRIIREFIKIIEMEKGERLKYFSDRVGAKRKAKISFNSEEEISKLKQDKSYKVNERNALGVKSSEGWIYNLNIGNIMHLAPMDFDEMHLSFLPENLKQKTNSELNKDIIIEKIVYITVAYF